MFDVLSRRELLKIAIETYLCRIELVRRSRLDFVGQEGRFRSHVEVCCGCGRSECSDLYLEDKL